MNGTITVRTAFGMVIISVLLAVGLGSAIAPVTTAWFPHSNTLITSFLSIVVGQGFMIVPVLVFLRRQHYPLVQTLRLNPVPFPVILSVFILSLGLVILMDEVDRITALWFPLPDYLSDISQALIITSWSSAILLVLALVILAPLGEELLFRGFLQRTLENAWPDITKAVLITSLFFAFIHLNPYWMIQIYVLAVMLGYLAWRSDSVIPSFILHLVNNAVALTFNNLNDSVLQTYYLWRGHVALPWLVGGGLLVFFGYRMFHTTLEASS
ncbi:MAG: CPBP family intramembrane metalloprotease [FCB group bacterium]|nr:CPBP family intramembrane metalloprotease [FCB group bacterium]